MKKSLKIIVIGVFAIFIIFQFIRPARNNPAVTKAETLESAVEVPENVEAILARSCVDCHTNKTNYPWYSNVTPFNWFLARHIDEGRRELNFSVWNTYEKRRKNRKLEQICEQISDRKMPLPSYLWIHRNAELSDNDIKILCDWTIREKAKMAQIQ